MNLTLVSLSCTLVVMNETPTPRKVKRSDDIKGRWTNHITWAEGKSLYADLDHYRFPGEYEITGSISSAFVRDVVNRYNAETAWEREEIDSDIEMLANADPWLIVGVREMKTKDLPGYPSFTQKSGRRTSAVGNTVTGTSGRRNQRRGSKA